FERVGRDPLEFDHGRRRDQRCADPDPVRSRTAVLRPGCGPYRAQGVKAAEARMKLAGKAAIVTGGAKGIGFGIARRFVAEGARVVIADVDADAGLRATASLAAAAQAVPAGVSRPADVPRLVAQHVPAYRRLDNR